jgi:hypothetical protein
MAATVSGRVVSEVLSVAGDQADPVAILPRQDAGAVVLDLMNPTGTGRRFLSRAGKAWLEGRGAVRKAPPDFVVR